MSKSKIERQAAIDTAMAAISARLAKNIESIKARMEAKATAEMPFMFPSDEAFIEAIASFENPIFATKWTNVDYDEQGNSYSGTRRAYYVSATLPSGEEYRSELFGTWGFTFTNAVTIRRAK